LGGKRIHIYYTIGFIEKQVPLQPRARGSGLELRPSRLPLVVELYQRKENTEIAERLSMVEVKLSCLEKSGKENRWYHCSVLHEHLRKWM
jgi:hypothetical protein